MCVKSKRRASTAIFRKTPNSTPPKSANRCWTCRFGEIEDKVARAQVIDVSKLSGDKVVFGAHGGVGGW